MVAIEPSVRITTQHPKDLDASVTSTGPQPGRACSHSNEEGQAKVTSPLRSKAVLVRNTSKLHCTCTNVVVPPSLHDAPLKTRGSLSLHPLSAMKNKQ